MNLGHIFRNSSQIPALWSISDRSDENWWRKLWRRPTAR